MKTKTTLNTLMKQSDEIKERMNAIFLDRGLKIYEFEGLTTEEAEVWHDLKNQSDQITAQIVESILQKRQL